MNRVCTDVKAFVMMHGVEEYKNEFCQNVTIHELLQDEHIASGNEEYEKNNGSGVTEHHRCEYIKKWGVSQYQEWFERDNDCLTIMTNPRFAEAQEIFLKKHVHKEITVSFDPFHRNLRDKKGIAIPEPCMLFKDEQFYDDHYDLYIQTHGILNYMLIMNSDERLETLLCYPDVASWQQCYIRKLDYEDKIESYV